MTYWTNLEVAMNRAFFTKHLLFSLRAIGLLEGLSNIALFFVAMPMKYIGDNDSLIYPIGMAHGALFIGFCIYLGLTGLVQKWKFSEVGWGFLASLIPIGTFVFDAKILRKKVAESKAVSR